MNIRFREEFSLHSEAECVWFEEHLCAGDLKFKWRLDKDAGDWDSIWFYTDFMRASDGEEPMQLARVMQQFFAEMRPDGAFVLSWACVRDEFENINLGKHEFGGGAIVVTATKLWQIDTDMWVRDRLMNHKGDCHVEKLKRDRK